MEREEIVRTQWFLEAVTEAFLYGWSLGSEPSESLLQLFTEYFNEKYKKEEEK